MLETIYLAFVVVALISFYLAFTIQKQTTRILFLFFTLMLFAMLSLQSMDIEKVHCHSEVTDALQNITSENITEISVTHERVCETYEYVDEPLAYFFGFMCLVLLCLLVVTFFQTVDELGVLL